MKHFEIENHGTLVLVKPITEFAKEWWYKNVDPHADMYGKFFVVETRYLEPIMQGFYDTRVEIGDI